MSNDDRECGGAEGAYRDRTTEGHLMTGWTEEDLAHVAADELSAALDAHGIHVRGVVASGLDVDVSFTTIRDAETMLTLSMDGSGGPGSLYDRATSSCLTVTELASTYGTDVPGGRLEAAFRMGWDWQVHPDMHGRRMGWHISVTLAHTDANTVTAALNALRNLGDAS